MVKDPPANAGDLRDASLIPGLGTERCLANRWRQRYQGEIRILCHMDFFFLPTHISHMSCIGRWILYHWTTGLPRPISFAYNLQKENNQLISLTCPVSDLIFWASVRERETTFSIIQGALVVKNPKCRVVTMGLQRVPPQVRSSLHTHTPERKS